MQLRNIGYARASDGYFKYVVEGSRMSGDMNTSMGNKLIMCLMGKAYLDSLSIPYEFANNGDDCLIFTETKYLKKLSNLKSYFADFGFNIVTEEPVYTFEHVEFCQTKPLISNGVWRMIRNVRSCLTKDTTCVNLGHDVLAYRRLLNSIGDCGLAFAADVPILHAFYKMLKRFGLEGKYWSGDTGFNYYVNASRNAHCPATVPDQNSRYSFWMNSGITPDQQMSIEGYFNESVWGEHNRQVIDFDINTLFFQQNGQT